MSEVEPPIDQEGGFVRLYRRLLEDPDFANAKEAMAFAYLILKAAWRPTTVRYKGQVINLERGQLALSVRDFAAEFEWSKDKCFRWLQRLNRDKVATASATGVTIITICNYDKYQGQGDDGATAPRQHPRQHRDSTATQNNEENELNIYGYVLGSAPAHEPAREDPPLGGGDWLGPRKGDPRKFAYVGRVLSVTHHDWAEFAEAYPNIELRGAIVACDTWLASLAPDDRRRTEPEASLSSLASFLSRRNQDAKERSHERTPRRHGTFEPAGSAQIANPGTRAALALVDEARGSG